MKTESNVVVVEEVVEVVVTKAEKALIIYNEEFAKGVDKLRARVIERFIKELDMGKPGSSTYFQNCKKKAVGEKVKHYYKKVGEKTVVETVDDSKEEQDVFEVELKDETIKCFLSQQELTDFVENNKDLIKEVTEVTE